MSSSSTTREWCGFGGAAASCRLFALCDTCNGLVIPPALEPDAAAEEDVAEDDDEGWRPKLPGKFVTRTNNSRLS
jgi:hypothetical protein